MGPSGVKQDQMVPNGAKQGQTGPNGVNGLIFCMHTYFYEIKKLCLATQALRQKLAELWGFCYFLGYYRPSLKALLLFLYLSQENFLYII